MALQTLPTPQAAAQWLAAQVSGSLTTDSRRITAGDGFIAWPGYAVDGRQFVAAALQAGAAACLVEAGGAEAFGFDDPRVAALPGLKAATGAMADAFYGEPSAGLDTVAVTGTNGKTSTAWWMAQALSALGRRCGVIGTLGMGQPPAASTGGESAKLVSTGLTTPDPVTLHAALRAMADQGFSACALEASSIGLAEHRLDALRIAVALFTNFTQDHLDYHGSMEAYWAAKRALFNWPGLKAAVINVDDIHGARLASELSGSSLEFWTVSVGGTACLSAHGLHYAGAGLAFELREGAAAVAVHTQLVGDFNVSNLLVVLAGLRALGVTLVDAARVVPQLTPVPGRLQRVTGAGLDVSVDVLVDYAHTPDALDKALAAVRPLAAARGRRLWCVFGCGGNRDASKRPLMGAIAARRADRVVITSDNPRDEAPGLILAQILAGVTGHDEVEVFQDRRDAIQMAVREAAAGDVILLAGKGHEDYQEIAGIKRPFSDVAEAQAALAQRQGARA
jgi:UDP-N-acetylmuramoyl-L-alanyl-D-glutamate--2,6-diaminopimelate ligase